MRRTNALLIAGLIFAAACQAPQFAPADSKSDFTGRVVAVGDGDSITVLDESRQQRRVRFFAIDSPEMSQPFGKQAKIRLSDLIFGRTVTVEVHGRDRYQRVVGKVFLDGLDVNLEQVKAGFAWHYRDFESQQTPADRLKYREAEAAAREAKLGLWNDADPEPPWRYRKDEREP